jgi:hypothetical protein
MTEFNNSLNPFPALYQQRGIDQYHFPLGGNRKGGNNRLKELRYI